MKPDPLPEPRPDLKQAILGIWRLVSREDYDREGRRLIDPFLGSDPLGVLSFASGYFAAQFMNRRRTGIEAPMPGSTQPGIGAAGSATNNSSAVGGYDAYFGTYEVDERAGTIAIALEGALSPGNVGMKMTRDVRVLGDRLWIRLSTNAADGTPITRTLTFERIPGSPS
jgi:lipocalin-like protein